MKPEKRNIALCIVFSIITCGIYGLYWLVKLNDEINMVSDHTGDTSGGMVLLFAIITCGIYTMYWSYRIGIKLDEAVVKRGLPAQKPQHRVSAPDHLRTRSRHIRAGAEHPQ